jgi:hypothetical protein
MPEHLTDVVTLVIIALVMSWFLPVRGAEPVNKNETVGL